MPSYKGDDGSLILDPQGDLLFGVGGPAPDDDRIELMVMEPGITPGVGALCPDYAGASSMDVPTPLRIKLTARSAVVLLEAVTNCLVRIHGMPDRPEPPEGGVREPAAPPEV